MARKFNIVAALVVFAMVMAAVPAFAGTADPFSDSAQVSATVMQQSIQVTVDTNNLPYGVVPLNNHKSLPVLVTNSGNGEEDLQILATAPTNGTKSWTFAASIGALDECVWNVSSADASPAAANVNLQTGAQNLWLNVPAGTPASSASFAFDLKTPATSSGTGQYGMSATIQAATSY
jgi:hypothetical protein